MLQHPRRRCNFAGLMTGSTAKRDIDEWFRNETEIIRPRGKHHVCNLALQYLERWLTSIACRRFNKDFWGKFRSLAFFPHQQSGMKAGNRSARYKRYARRPAAVGGALQYLTCSTRSVASLSGGPGRTLHILQQQSRGVQSQLSCIAVWL